jgi:hypothetical protein
MLYAAARLVPGSERRGWLEEWRGELCHVQWELARAARPEREAIAFCAGAFADALWLRRNSGPRCDGEEAGLRSPVWCLALLAFSAAGAAIVALQLPVGRELLLPSPYPDSDRLVLLSTGARASRDPAGATVADYRWLTTNGKREVSDAAFYKAESLAIQSVHNPAGAVLSGVVATEKLFGLLGLEEPAGRTGGSQGPWLVLSEEVWRARFRSDEGIVGSDVHVGGRRVRVASVLSARSWRLPVHAEAWLIADDDSIPGLLGDGKGFLVARARHRIRGWEGSLAIPVDDGGSRRYFYSPLAKGRLAILYLLMVGPAVVLLVLTTPLGLGEYPRGCHSPPVQVRLRRWLFLAAKLVLLIVIVFCGAIDLTPLGSAAIQPHGVLLGYLLAFRWALGDQRQRCPVCLGKLTHPTSIGWCSQTFLDWYGTELICSRGHGLLYVPEVRTSCYGPQRWQYLDPSWRGLFQ